MRSEEDETARVPLYDQCAELPLLKSDGAPKGILLGRYRILAELGAGRMGISYLAVARDCVDLEHLFVMRVLRPEFAEDKAVTSIFIGQSRLANHLLHPNIVRTIDVCAEGPRPFVATEFVDGQLLENLLARARERSRTIPLEVHLRILLDVLSALVFAHALTAYGELGRGVVHGELSPRKIFVTAKGEVKVVDFGVPQKLPIDAPTARLFRGVRYTAPEVIAGKDVDERADHFAVGAMLWEAVIGQPPWHDQADIVVLEDLLCGRIPRPGDAAPDIDSSLAAIIERSMAGDPDSRYRCAREMREDLERFAAGRVRKAKQIARRSAAPRTSTARDALGTMVSVLFVPERRSVENALEANLERRSDAPIQRWSRWMEPPQGAPPSRPAISPEIEIGATPRDHAASSLPPVERDSLGTSILKSNFSLAIPLGLILASVALCQPVDRSPRPQVEDGPAASAPVAAPSGTVPSARVARLAIRASPASAQLLLDDAPIPNPFVINRSDDGLGHVLRAEARGYVARTLSVTFQNDTDIEIELAAMSSYGPAPLDVRADARARAALPATKLFSSSVAASAGEKGDGSPPGALDPSESPRRYRSK